MFEIINRNAEKFLTKTNKYSILSTEILYPKTENVNIQTKLKPVWFELFPILYKVENNDL